ncbi:hypothetical protein [Micromonospora maritima]|uniref:hypothetical protein n=1 Tax=Micromonospora maritima TaxID=986711 RepID=UPI00157D2BAB|nr:hypothetical protein [Micromonospora maritima]
MGVIELRVHGVGGHSSDRILGERPAHLVAGDVEAGFYRPGAGPEDQQPAGEVRLEAYRWNGLTGGTAGRTFSLVLLLPFMLGNIALWALPLTGRAGAPARSVVRLLSVSLTMMYVLAVVGVALDLVAWQCLSYPRCYEDRRFISWLAGLPAGWELAILALFPLAAITALWRLGSRTWQLPETRAPDGGDTEIEGLDEPAFWDNRSLVRHLRAVHLAAALGTLDAAVLSALVPHDRRLTGYLLFAAVLLVTAAALIICCLPGIERRTSTPRAAAAARALARTSGVLTVAVLAYSLVPRDSWTAADNLPGYDVLVATVYVSQMVLLTALAALVVAARRHHVTSSAVLRGLAAPVLILVAIGFAVSYSSGLVYLSADYLDRGSSPTPARPTPPGAPPLTPPVAFRWAALGFFLAVVLAAVVVLTRRLWRRSARRAAAMRTLRAEYAELDHVPAARVAAARDAIVSAQLADKLGPLAPAAYATLATIALGAAGSAILHDGPGDLARVLGGEPLARPVVFVTDLGAYLIGTFAVLLGVFGLFAYRSRGIRLIGILWELATFWPRGAHPLAAPCYSERAVPDLTRRVRHLIASGDTVVLAGQSHGSVLAAVTALQLPPATRSRLALLTFASPLQRLYARVFPAYINDVLLRRIGSDLDWRWTNLWRRTDPVGGPVFLPDRGASDDPAAGVDRLVRDPAALTVAPGNTVPPPIERHLFRFDDTYRAAVRDLAARLPRR